MKKSPKTLQQFNQVVIIMGAHIEYIKLIVIKERKTFHFDLPRDTENNLMHEIASIIKHNKILPEHTIKNEVTQLFSKYEKENAIHEDGKQQNQ